MRVLGLPELLSEIDAMAAEIETDGTHDATMAAAEHLREAWVANIEEEGLVDTGRYRDSPTVKSEGKDAVVVSDVPYAPLLEHGTAYMAPHPVAERALDEDSGAAVDAAGESLRGRL